MQSHFLDIAKIPNRKGQPLPVMMVGCVGMVLYGSYDPDQTWLPFMQGTVFVPQETPNTETGKLTQAKINRVHAPVPDDCRRPYRYEDDVPQMVLPFVEFRKVSNGDQKKLEQTKFPGWDRDSKGNLYRITFTIDRYEAVKDWCEVNCRKRYVLKRTSAVFESAEEAFPVKLFFHGA